MDDRLLTAGRAVLRIANALNWFCAALLALGVILSFPYGATLLHVLAAKYRGMDMVPVLWAMRVIGLFAVPMAAVLHVLFTRLGAIVDTARAGDPFVAVNASRLRAIGWALLCLQLLDLVFGMVTVWLGTLHVDRLDWSPSLGGWIAVLMVFILARVFTIGARMRDELELTV